MDEYRLHPSVVTYWRNGSLEPWPDALEATETVWFPLPEEDNGVRYWEGLTGRLSRDGVITVLGVPAYAYNLNLGDQVTVVRSDNNAFVATEITERSRNSTYRFYLTDDSDDVAWYPLAQEFAQLGCLIDVLTPRFVALSCSPESSPKVSERLMQLQLEGSLNYETGHQPQNDG